MLDDALKNVSVIGAAGKMGSGIALLILQEMARLELELYGHVGKGKFTLHLIDIDKQSLVDLRTYLRGQMIKYAEKNIDTLRKGYSKNLQLISNKDIIETYVEGAIDLVYLNTHLEDAADSTLIFEAIAEKLETKISLLHSLRGICKKALLFLTNTSSIPISYLNQRASLNNRLIGFHFYNPSAIQKLIEFVSLEDTDPHLKGMALELAARLHKKVVQTNDVAGFIGNGFLMREIVFATELISELSNVLSEAQAIYFVNRITQDYLLRPMGIFQLVDYMGINVCQEIATVMDSFFVENHLITPLIKEMNTSGKIGGHTADGMQKDGFFQYQGSEPVGIYSLAEKEYVPIDHTWHAGIEKAVGDF